MSKVLVLYGSTYGQTLRVAERIRQVVQGEGHEAELVWGADLPEGLQVAAYDGVVIAASVLMGRYQPYVRDFVRRHAHRLSTMPSAFVSVSGAASADPPLAQSYIDRFLLETGWWKPTLTCSLTGAVAYTRYRPLLRWWLKQISRRKGLPTDTSRDWDFTEWNEVERFARRFAHQVAGVPAERSWRELATVTA